MKSQEENVECKTEIEVTEQQVELNISTKNEMPDEPFDDQKDIKTDSNDSDFEVDNFRYVNCAN